MKYIFWQYFLPQHLLSYLVGKLARCEIRWLKNFLIERFIYQYKIDLQDALEKDPYKYANLESFFIRKVDSKMRPFAAGKDVIGSPVDGMLSQMGRIDAAKMIQAKGYHFDLVSLFASLDDAKKFHDGFFITIYLAPKNYHRIYMPIAATLQKILHIPGKLFSVNAQTSCKIPNLYSRNERSILFFQKDNLPFAIVLVGAMIVSSIKTPWTNNPPDEVISGKIKRWDFEQKNIYVLQGAEVGLFSFGSTVILLLTKDSMGWNQTKLTLSQPLRIGQFLGKL